MVKKMLPPIHLACSDDELRPALQHVEIIDGIATATNAHVIARMNLSAYCKLDDTMIAMLNGKLIHKDVWENIMDADVLTVLGDHIYIEMGGIKADYNIANDYKFPDHHSLIQAVSQKPFR